jgi:hypothetical protein
MKTLLITLAVLLVLAVAAIAIFVFVVQNVETPEYVTVESDGAFEVRDYPALVVAEVTRQGPRREALSAGFGPLARYIFAKERGGETIAMTAPVTQQANEAIAMTAPVTQASLGDGVWSVRFIMPARYRLEDLPAPGSAEIRLAEVPARRRAAVRFSGSTSDVALAKQETALRDWIRARGLVADGAAVFAYYNDPFTPGFLRRNEVLIDLLPTDQDPQ